MQHWCHRHMSTCMTDNTGSEVRLSADHGLRIDCNFFSLLSHTCRPTLNKGAHEVQAGNVPR